jgi:DNA-binding transcriptional ArsR family regulator
MLEPALIPVVAARFKALADPGRLAILSALQEGEKSVSALVAATGRSQPNVSQHLSGLARAGFVSPRREGNHVFYRIVDPYVARICDSVCKGLDRQLRDGRALLAGPAGDRGRARAPRSRG